MSIFQVVARAEDAETNPERIATTTGVDLVATRVSLHDGDAACV
jgi:hypothetical protein